MKQKFDVKGMTCAACQAHVSKAVEKLDGTNDVNVNLLQNNMVVDFDESKCSIEDIEKAVKNAGYEAYVPSMNKKVETKTKDYSLLTLIFAICDLLILMYFSMGHMMWGWPAGGVNMHTNPMGFALVQFILVLPIIYVYRRYFISGFTKLFKGAPNMDTLVGIGAFVSMVYGIYCLFMISMGHTEYHMYLYFEAAGMILTFVSIGKYLEGLSKRKTTNALTKLMDLAPKTAVILVGAEEVTIDAKDVKLNDIVIVRKGDSVPVDGIIIEGNGSFDQANITGESMPVFKKVNDEAISSTILKSGYVKIRATKVGEDTSIATIIRLVEEASNSKAPISKLADKISGIFVPIILSIALVVFVVNFIISKEFETALNFAITVIVIACPCALGLATPVAIMVGTGKGAQNGLLIKNAEILERAHLITTVVLDKTGTITEGKPQVVDFINYSEGNLLSIVYSLENKSEHPLANSICEYAKLHSSSLMEVESFTSMEGRGIKGTIKGKDYYVGNYRYLEDLNKEDEEIKKEIDKFSLEGKTPLIVALDNKVVGLITIKDKVKENSKEAIASLKAKGIEVVMLTGDNQKTAEAIASEVGVDRVISDVLPVDKQNIINGLKTNDRHLVAMVGDGVNDALALTSADIGIAIGAGSDVALDSADIVLVRNDLMDVLNVIALSKRTLNTIKAGLFWAFFYNFVCVILSTGFLYYLTDGEFKMTPMIGAIAMSISSVSVVLNALTINLFKVKKSKVKEENIIDIEEIKEENSMNKVEVKVEGMMCQHCVAHVKKALEGVNGVSEVEVSLENKNAIVSGTSLDNESLKKAVEEAGYEVKDIVNK